MSSSSAALLTHSHSRVKSVCSSRHPITRSSRTYLPGRCRRVNGGGGGGARGGARGGLLMSSRRVVPLRATGLHSQSGEKSLDSAGDGDDVNSTHWRALCKQALLAPAFTRAVVSGGVKKNNLDDDEDSQHALRRVDVRTVSIKNAAKVQIVKYTRTQAFTKNYDVGSDDANSAIDDLLRTPLTNWRVEHDDGDVLQVKITKKGKALIKKQRQNPSSSSSSTNLISLTGRTKAVIQPHDRVKTPKLLPEDDPALVAVGISSTDGRVRKGRYSKYAQIESFLKHLQHCLATPTLKPVVEQAANESDAVPIRIVDLGCGNAYLTFATAAYLLNQQQVACHVVGVDIKRQAREHNTTVAEKLGWNDRLQFVEGRIDNVELEAPPDVVVALHACDTATDAAIVRGIRWPNAKLLLIAPCCHHDVGAQMKSQGKDRRQPILMRHGLLRERLADVVTDAVRSHVLRILGFKVDVVEFASDEHTPRNLLIRAVRTNARPSISLFDELDELLDETFGVTPWLIRELASEIEAARSAASK
ncbi:glutathione S-transferase [Pycnococcus provasolii]